MGEETKKVKAGEGLGTNEHVAASDGGATREVKIGQHVILHLQAAGEEQPKLRDALVTAIHGKLCINVVCICEDDTSNDCNGRIPGDAFTSVCYNGDAGGNDYWRFSD